MTPEQIVRRLAAMQTDEAWVYDCIVCALCDGDCLYDPTGTIVGADHEPDCPYAAALEWVAENPEPLGIAGNLAFHEVTP